MRHLFAISALTIMLGFFAWRPVGAQYALGPGMYDDDFLHLSYTGTWSEIASAGSYNDTVFRSCTNGDSVSFDFWGDELTWYTNTAASGTDVNVCIDGSCVNVPTFSGSTVLLVTFTFAPLGYGTHSASLTHVGTSGSECIRVDAFHIAPPAPQPTLPPQEIVVELTFIPVQPTIVVPTPQPERARQYFTVEDLEGNPQVAAFDYTLSASDVLLAILLMVIASMGLIYLIYTFLSKQR